MVERFSQVFSKEQIKTFFPTITFPAREADRYNISPLKAAYIVSNKESNRLQKHQWGLVCAASRDGSNSGSLINARIEQLPASISFRIPIRSQRCLIPIDSFYVWSEVQGKRVPHRIFSNEDSIMWMSGLWDSWSNGKIVKYTFSVITRPSPGPLLKYTKRIPIFLNDNLLASWLDPIDLRQVMEVLHTNKVPELRAYKISTKVNSTKYNASDIQKQELYVPTLFD